jgi:hypothetical protein
VYERPTGTSVFDVVREQALSLAEAIERGPYTSARGGLPYLIATSPALRRWSLDMFADSADLLASLLASERGDGAVDPVLTTLARAMMAPTEVLLEEFGRRMAGGAEPHDAARGLRDAVETAFERLARGLGQAG